jgi:outer membrane protein insertion porin family
MRRLVAAAACAAACVLGARALPAQEPGEPMVDSLEVVGNRRVTRETIINAASIPLRTAIGYRDLQRAIRALHDLGQFDDVQIARRDGDAGEEILVIVVRERPIVARTSVRGPDKVSPRSVRDRVEIINGRPLDQAAVARAVQRIDSLYEGAGYYLAEIRPIITPLAGDSGSVLVVFDIVEGRRIAISSIRVEGNTEFPASQIVAAMRTRPEGFWWFQKGEFSDERLREDLERRLPEFYGSRGYIDFRIVRDTLLVHEDNGKATLVLEVDEGRPHRVGTVEVEGNRYFSSEQVLSLNPFNAGRPTGLRCLFRNCGAERVNWFDQVAWEAATNRLRTEYANQGYIYADVRPEVERTDTTDAAGIPVVNLSWQINEQRPAIVNRIDIVGNNVTHERVIREAIVVLPGDVFSQERIIRSYQNVSNLGFFQQPLPFPDTRPANEEGDIDLIFRVEERNTGNVNFGASVGQGTGVGGFLGLDEPNLFGQGKRGRLQWQFGRNINDFDISYSDPALLRSRVSGTVGLHNTRIRYTIADLGRITSRGGNVQLGFPLPRSRYSRLFVSYAAEWESYSGNSATLSGLRCRNCFRSTLGTQFVRDTRINLPFATGGSLHQVGGSFNGGFLGGSATFQRYDLEGRWYAPAGRLGGGPNPAAGVALVLGLSAKSGFVFGDPGPFFRQMFAMGGTQYGIQLRGYDEFSITPQGFNPSASVGGVPRSAFGQSYFSTTAEFGARFSQAFYANLFYDAGNVWQTPAGFNPARLFRGAGVGAAVITPLGPLGLDFAYGFDRTNVLGQSEPGWKIHFRIGNFF